MKFIKESEYDELEKGCVISIEGSLEVVTKVLEHTFYSAPVFGLSSFEDNPFRRSSHWVGSLDSNGTIIVFEDTEEAINYIKTQVKGLKDFYELN